MPKVSSGSLLRLCRTSHEELVVDTTGPQQRKRQHVHVICIGHTVGMSSGRSPASLATSTRLPVQVVKDFLLILTQMHLKGYKGWRCCAEYCTLGMRTVDIPAILKMVE